MDETAPVYYITTLARGHNPPQSMGAAPCGHQFARSFSHLASSFRACPGRRLGKVVDRHAAGHTCFSCRHVLDSPLGLIPPPLPPYRAHLATDAGLAHRATRTAVPARAALAWPRRFLPVSCSGHTCACTGSDRVGIARALQGCCNVLGRVLLFSLRLETKTETKIVFIFRD